ncbi:MAG TPA: hypothetical protein VN936_00175, partial [Candidatus Acidoferrum sp.]|nr:hypothetical protein [Candidatus Acidoferrum sp.]
KFFGAHPAAALPTLQRLRPQLEPWHELTRAMAQAQPFAIKLRNVARAANYEVRWRGRSLDPFARSLLR